MKKHLKRSIALFLSFVLALGLAGNAFAADDGPPVGGEEVTAPADVSVSTDITTSPEISPDPVDTDQASNADPVGTDPANSADLVDTDPANSADPVDTDLANSAEPVDTDLANSAKPVDTDLANSADPVDTDQVAGIPSTTAEISGGEIGVKALYAAKGTPASLTAWNAEEWNFSETIDVGGINGATLKFAALCDTGNFYLGMLIEDAGDATPFVEVILDGDNTTSGGVEANGYGYILQWSPCSAESWQQLNFARGTKDGTNSKKYPDAQNGSYAIVITIPWTRLTAPNEDGSVTRQNGSLMRFSLAAGCATLDSTGKGDWDNSKAKVFWTEFGNAWGSPLSNAGTIIVNNSDLSGDAPAAPHTVTVASGIANGAVTVNKTFAGAGETVTVTATPDSGYKVDTVTVSENVTVTKNANGTYSFTMPDTDVNVTATFVVAVMYSLTITDSVNGSAAADKATATDGETVTVTVTPDSGYEVDTVTVTANGTVVSTAKNNNAYTFTMPSSDVTVTVTFKPASVKAVTVATAENGSVTVDKQTAAAGETVTVTAIPSSGYKVESVIISGDVKAAQKDGNTYTFTMPGSEVTVTVTFKQSAADVPVSAPEGIALSGKIPNPITVDGKLTESVWAEQDRYSSVATLADFTINNNTSSFATAWDDDNFYVAMTVTDGTVITKDNGTLQPDIYNNDGVEFFIDADNSKETSFDKKNDFHIFIRHDGELLVWGGDGGTWAAPQKTFEMKHQVVMTEKGFDVEVSIPWTSLGVKTPADGTLVGLGVINNDNDNPTANARKEITWLAGQNSGKPVTWGTLCLYETRKPLFANEGDASNIANNKTNPADWNAGIWKFNDYYSLPLSGTTSAKAKFSALCDSENFYLGMLLEGAAENDIPFVEVILDGDNTRTGAVTGDTDGNLGNYGYVIQWSPRSTEGWQKVNFGKGLKTGTSTSKFDLGNGSYAAAIRIPWSLLTAANGDGSVIRQDHSLMSFSVAAGCATLKENGQGDWDNAKGKNFWVNYNSGWAGNALEKTATIIMNNPNIIPTGNIAPEGTPYYSYSVQQGGTVSGKVNVTDANQEDTLTFRLENSLDASKGTVTVNETTGAWTYTAPAGLLTGAAPGVSFYIVTSDNNERDPQTFRTRVEVKVEPAPSNTTYYVDGDTGSDSNDGLSRERALKTIMAAHDKTKPGDTVLIYGSETPYGWYTDAEYEADTNLYGTIRNGVVVITRSGLPDAPITYKAAPGEAPVIKGNDVWNNLVVSANYIVVEGLTVRGECDQLTYDEAWKAFWGKMADKSDPEYNSDWGRSMGAANSNGMEVKPAKEVSTVGKEGVYSDQVSIPHHVTFRHCTAEYLGGSGIGGSECDYVTFENCTAVNNCWWGMYGNSGIGFIKTADVDDNKTDYKLIIRNCISAGNRHFIPWKAGTVRLSDGNGIIMDTCDEHEHDYQGKTLIANNLVYENGGSGIHTFRSNNVDIINNTIFNNGATPELGWSEMFANDSVKVNMFNNLVYSRTGNREDPAQSASAAKPVSYDYNLFFNYKSGSNIGSGSAGVTVGTNNKYNVNPLFTNVTPVVHMPEGFDVNTGYESSWYTTKTAASGTNPAQWTQAGNAKAAGWYPGVSYDVNSYGYDFTLQANSPALGAADAGWQAAAGGASYANRVGIFSEVGSCVKTGSTHTHTPVYNPAVEPTETAPGNIAYWTCGICGKFFRNADCTIEISLADTVVSPVSHIHTPVYHPAVEATYTAPGCSAYWSCVGCGKLFLEEACQIETTQEALVIPQLVWPVVPPAAPSDPGNSGTSKPSQSSEPDSPSQPDSPGNITKPTGDTYASIESETDGTTSTAVVDSETAEAIVAEAVEKDSSNIYLIIDAPVESTESVVILPAHTVSYLVERTGADLTVQTPVADITIGSVGLADLGSGAEAVEISAKASGDTIQIAIAKDGRAVKELTGGIQASIPVEDAVPGTVAIMVGEDGSETILKKSVVRDGEMDLNLSGSATIRIVDNSKTFRDVQNHWAGNAIDFVTSRELFQGTSDDIFSANLPMSRAMLVTVLHRLEDMPTGNVNAAFTDVAEDRYYTSAVSWASGLGIVTGDSTGFHPDNDVTREQLVTFLYRYAKAIGVDTSGRNNLNGFGDSANVSNWAVEAMQWAVSAGIINGSSGNLNPEDSATRAEVATILMRFCQNLGE